MIKSPSAINGTLCMLGTELLSTVRKVSPNTMRILLTGYSDLAAIVGSVNDEIFRFVNKPWNNEEMKAIVGEAARIALETSANQVRHRRRQRLPSQRIPAPAPPYWCWTTPTMTASRSCSSWSTTTVCTERTAYLMR